MSASVSTSAARRAAELTHQGEAFPTTPSQAQGTQSSPTVRARPFISSEQFADRAAGAIVGSIIGDALGVASHWYYDLIQLQERFGEITGYARPYDDWYHAGTAPGDYSQSAEVGVLLLKSMTSEPQLSAGCQYHQHDFCGRMDALLATLDMDKLPRTGRAGYTDGQMAHVARARRLHQHPWGSEAISTTADTSEGSQRAVIISARYAFSPDLHLVAQHCWQNISLTYHDSLTVGLQATFNVILARLIQGYALDSQLIDADFGRMFRRLPALTATTPLQLELPFYDHDDTVKREVLWPLRSGDATVQPQAITRATESGLLSLDQPALISQVFGSSCSAPFVLGTSYYLGHVFRADFSAGVCAAANGGGNTVARGAHTGALIGAQVGLSGVPSKWVDGLTDGEQIVAMAKQIAKAAAHDFAIHQTGGMVSAPSDLDRLSALHY